MTKGKKKKKSLTKMVSNIKKKRRLLISAINFDVWTTNYVKCKILDTSVAGVITKIRIGQRLSDVWQI